MNDLFLRFIILPCVARCCLLMYHYFLGVVQIDSFHRWALLHRDSFQCVPSIITMETVIPIAIIYSGKIVRKRISALFGFIGGYNKVGFMCLVQKSTSIGCTEVETY